MLTVLSAAVLQLVPSPVHSLFCPTFWSTLYSPVFDSSVVLDMLVDCSVLTGVAPVPPTIMNVFVASAEQVAPGLTQLLFAFPVCLIFAFTSRSCASILNEFSRSVVH
jgi:hypothetical protein